MMADPPLAGGYEPGPLQAIYDRWGRQPLAFDNAIAKAFALLSSKLSPAQLRCLNKKGFFYVIGGSGDQYKIECHTVCRYNGVKSERLCVYPEHKSMEEFLPVYDNMLAIKLAIEADEEEFLKRANHFPIS